MCVWDFFQHRTPSYKKEMCSWKRSKTDCGVLFLHFDPFCLYKLLLGWACPHLPSFVQILLEFVKIFFKVLKCWFFLVLLQRSAVILVSTTSHAWSLASSFLLFELFSTYFVLGWCLFVCLFFLIWFWRLTTTEGEEVTWDGGFWAEAYEYSNCSGVKTYAICKIAHKSV